MFKKSFLYEAYVKTKARTNVVNVEESLSESPFGRKPQGSVLPIKTQDNDRKK
jgi:hypothetical protein